MIETRQLLERLAFSERPLLLYGAGRFGRMALLTLESLGIEPAGFLDLDVRRHGTLYLDRPILPFDDPGANIGESHVLITVNAHNTHEPLELLRRLGVPESRLFTNNIANYHVPAFAAVDSLQIDTDISLYGLSEYLADDESRALFARRYRHAVWRDSPDNPVCAGESDEDAVAVNDADAPIPDAASICYRFGKALWWDLCHRWAELSGKRIHIEFGNEEPIMWRVLCFAVAGNPHCRLAFRPGRTVDSIRIAILLDAAYAS